MFKIKIKKFKFKSSKVPKVNVNPPKFRLMESLRHTGILKSFEFLHQFSKKQNMIKKNYH